MSENENVFDIAKKMDIGELNRCLNQDNLLVHYTLDENNNPLPCSISEWGALYRTKEGLERRYVGLDYIGDTQISTVFVGIDMDFGLVPILFETMIFDKDNQYIFCRYGTWKEAEAGHKDAIEYVKICK